AHQRIFQRQVEARGTWVTLTTGTTTQLVVDTAGLVTLGTNNAQTTSLFDLLVQRLPRGADSLDLGFFLFGAQGLVFTNLGNRTLDAATQHNIGTTTGHIGSDGDMTRHTSFSHDIGFTGVLLGVQHLVLDTRGVQACGDQLGVFNAGGTHQNRLTTFVAVLDVFQNGVELLVIGFKI